MHTPSNKAAIMGVEVRRGTGWDVGGAEEEGKQDGEGNAGGLERDELQINTSMLIAQLV